MSARTADLSEMKRRFLNTLRAFGPLQEQLVKEGAGHRRILFLARSQAHGRSGINNREMLHSLRKNDLTFSAEYEAIIVEIEAALNAALPPKERARLNSARYRARKQAKPESCPALRPEVSGYFSHEARTSPQVPHCVQMIELAGGFFDLDAKRAFQTEALDLVKQYAADPATLTAQLDELTDDFMPVFEEDQPAPKPKRTSPLVDPYVQIYRDAKVNHAQRVSA